MSLTLLIAGIPLFQAEPLRMDGTLNQVERTWLKRAKLKIADVVDELGE